MRETQTAERALACQEQGVKVRRKRWACLAFYNSFVTPCDAKRTAVPAAIEVHADLRLTTNRVEIFTHHVLGVAGSFGMCGILKTSPRIHMHTEYAHLVVSYTKATSR